MEELFFRIQRRLKRKGPAAIKEYLNEFWFEYYSADSEKCTQFAIVYYTEIENMFQITLEQQRPDPKMRSSCWLIRQHYISRCLDHFDNMVTPKYQGLINFPNALVLRTHQRVLNYTTTE